MKLDWAILADAGQVREGLAFVMGGGIDTVNANQIPAALNGTLLIRLLLHRTETGRPHKVELRFADEDGHELGKVEAEFMVPDNPDVPVGWDHSAMFALNIHGMPLQRWGRYSIEILADGNHLRTLNLRLKQITVPQQPTP